MTPPTWRCTSTSAPTLAAYFDAAEQIFGAGGRPHRGRLHTRDADHLGGAYPRHARFVALRDALDPHRRFGNEYLTWVFGL